MNTIGNMVETMVDKKKKHGAHVPVPPPPIRKDRGSGKWSTDFTEKEVFLIRQMAMNQWTISGLANKFGRTWLTMSRLIKGESWKHVPMPKSAESPIPEYLKSQSVSPKNREIWDGLGFDVKM